MNEGATKTIVQNGPSAARAVYRRDPQFCASLRLVTMYDLGTDSFTTRIDVLLNARENERGMIVGGDQINCLVQSTPPQRDGHRRVGELVMPNGPGISGSYAVMVNDGDLADMFRGMADAIDKAIKAT